MCALPPDPPPVQRVVVRHRIEPAPASGEPTLTDVVGDLIAQSDETFTIATRRGIVVVPRPTVVATRIIAPRPGRRGAPHRALSVEDLQRVMIDAWPPMERAALGSWVLRASRGFTGRGNSVVTVGDPGLALGDAIDTAQLWYAARGLPPNFTLAGPVGFDPWADPVGAQLRERGYAGRTPTLTLTAAVTEVVARSNAAAAERLGSTVTFDSHLEDDWLAAYANYRPIDEVAARAILTGPPTVVFARIDDEAAPIAIGRLAIAGGWGGIAAMWVDPAHRRAGLGRSLLTALASAAQRHGVTSLHLQTDSTNTAALTLYAAHGFVEHHAYVNVTPALP